ncbi:MAG: hypothetical protein JRJ15_06600, partial [Deltaproteobacteria bacterium]|nr:hypothetical protein [Deltaproteobacteria bacterium]
LYHFSTFVMKKEHRLFPRLRTIFDSYHNGLSYLEIVFKLSKPHGITSLGKGKYLVSLWASSNFYVIDLNARRIESRNLSGGNGHRARPGRITGAFAPKERQEIFSTYQFFDKRHNQTYFTTFFRERGEEVARDRHVTIKKYGWDTDQVAEVWDGEFGEATHYIAVSEGGRHLGLVQFGDYFDGEKRLLPSRILVLDMKDGKEWWIDNTGWSPTAHIDWDPVEDNVCYLSCHNGVILPNHDLLGFYFKKVYKWKIFGPASIHKYRIAAHGPEKVGIFTHDELLRMTIHKVFVHRGKSLIACTGFPNYVFFADAESMKYVRKVGVFERSGAKSVVGSLYPSPDGEKVFLITTGSFQVIDVESGVVEEVLGLGRIYDPFNHMISVRE